MKTSQQVHQDAESLLKSTKIIDLFSAFGTVHTVGSYAANIMWDPDIDLVVITNKPQESAIKAVTLLAETEQFQKLEYGDFENHPMTNRPESFIVNARREWQGQNWEIETWFVTKLGDQLDLVKKLKHISEEDKKSILEKKKQRSLSGVTKHHLSSWEIYKSHI